MLGPLFFIVFMNDFSRASILLFFILFADSTTVIIEGQKYNDLICDELSSLLYLDAQLQANKLAIHLNTLYVFFMEQ